MVKKNYTSYVPIPTIEVLGLIIDFKSIIAMWKVNIFIKIIINIIANHYYLFRKEKNKF